MLTAENMRQHIDDLCEKHDICRFDCQRGSQAFSIYAAEEITIPPIKSAISYATALHEIGHILGRHQLSHKTIVRERWAWRWARANAREWTPAMERHRQQSMLWYERMIKLGKQPAMTNPLPQISASGKEAAE